MSDIQEEQKRLYKRAEEIDKEQEINNKFSRIVRDKMKDKSAVEMIVLQDEEINELQDRINKAVEYIENDIRYYNGEDIEKAFYLYIHKDSVHNLLDILKGKE